MVNIAFLLHGSHVVVARTSKPDPGWSCGERLPSKHAEQRVISYIRGKKKKIGRLRLVSLCVVRDNIGTISLRTSLPCTHCARTAAKMRFTSVVCVDSTGTLVKLPIREILRRASPSMGTTLLPLSSLPEIHLRSPITFEHIVAKRKTIEVRLCTSFSRSFSVGQRIIIRYKDRGVRIMIQRIMPYTSFAALFKAEGLGKTLPDVTSLKEALVWMSQYYSPGKDVSKGVLAISFSI